IIDNTPDDFVLLSGDDGLALPILSLGGKGVISVTANVLPSKVTQMVESFLKGDVVGARKLHYELLEINSAMFIETNPIPVKTALSMMGKINEELRLPLCQMAGANKKKLFDVLKSYGLV
ncbi:MAG TPA: 4-hydroxy-tetrahydrodipicolinate synthase, partial [Deltaproteobacteria bacterium]|nr:4-hydroxy-tetrahydrodipicolinate synthase [Deltaproteobacteria bacterium]